MVVIPLPAPTGVIHDSPAAFWKTTMTATPGEAESPPESHVRVGFVSEPVWTLYATPVVFEPVPLPEAVVPFVYGVSVDQLWSIVGTAGGFAHLSV